MVEEKIKPNVYSDGRWVKKRGRFRFGFKQHNGVDENGLVTSVVTIAANESDTKYLDQVLDKLDLPACAWVMADKGYKSKYNDKTVSSRKLKNRFMRRTNRGNPFSDRERLINMSICQK